MWLVGAMFCFFSFGAYTAEFITFDTNGKPGGFYYLPILGLLLNVVPKSRHNENVGTPINFCTFCFLVPFIGSITACIYGLTALGVDATEEQWSDNDMLHSLWNTFGVLVLSHIFFAMFIYGYGTEKLLI